MKTVTAYAYYGTLGHEYTPVIKEALLTGEVYDRIRIHVPDEFTIGRNDIGQTLIGVPEGYSMLIDEIFHMDEHDVLKMVWGGPNGGTRKVKVDWEKMTL